MNIAELKKIIIESFSENRNSHAFLFVTNNIDKCYKEVVDIVKKINCPTKEDNCTCNICTTISSGTNPDFITIYPDGKEIRKEQTMELTDHFLTKPLISKYSTYVIVNADKMNSRAANKLLKFVEEPEERIIGFFITDKLDGMLSTIRSRCEIYNMRFGSDNILDLLGITEEEYARNYDFAFDLLNKLNGSPKYMLMSESNAFSSKERTDIDIIFRIIRQLYIFKLENITMGHYSNNEVVMNIIGNIVTDDINVILKRIHILDDIIEDFKMYVIKDLFINKFFLLWE